VRPDHPPPRRAQSGSYLVLLLHPWVFAVSVRECTPPDS
jgi:hypothetical protein